MTAAWLWERHKREALATRKSPSCVRSMWIDQGGEVRHFTPLRAEEQHLTPPTRVTAAPNTYVMPRALHKSCTDPIETETDRKGELSSKSYTSLKGSEGGLRAAEKTQLSAYDKWLSLNLSQSMVSICCDGEMHLHTVCRGKWITATIGKLFIFLHCSSSILKYLFGLLMGFRCCCIFT